MSSFEPMPEALFQRVLDEVLDDEAGIEALNHEWFALDDTDSEGLGGQMEAVEDGADG